MTSKNKMRTNEWFVAKFGPQRFRIFVGLLFLPYTGMCISFAVIGSSLGVNLIWDRLGAIALIYALALGVSAHVAHSTGSNKAMPWGNYTTKPQLIIMIL